MPEVIGEIHPFLCAVAAHRAIKQLANAGERLLLKCNEVVCGRGFLPGGQLELTVQGFQIVSNRIHRSIVPQFRPIVKSVFGDLHRISLIGLDLAERVVAVLLDEQRVDHRDIKDRRNQRRFRCTAFESRKDLYLFRHRYTLILLFSLQHIWSFKVLDEVVFSTPSAKGSHSIFHSGYL